MTKDFPPYIRKTYKPKEADAAYELTALWDYLSADGKAVVGHVARYDNPSVEGKSKQYLPYFDVTPDGGLRAGYSDSDLRPLFGLQTLANLGPIIITEGEKDAAALHQLGFAAVTSPGGANAADKADWSQLTNSFRFEDRAVIIWRDADEPGKHYARAVARQLIKLGKPLSRWVCYGKNGAGATDFVQCRLREWDGMSQLDADVADALRELVSSFLAEARPVELEDTQETHRRRPRSEKSVTDEDKAVLQKAASGSVQGPVDYAVAPSGALVRLNYGKEGEVTEIPVADFSVRIDSEVVRDDGQSTSRDLKVSGKRHGKQLPVHQVPASEFAKLDWVAEAWGAGCRVYPARTNREFLVDAARALSVKDGGEIPVSREFVHTGWTTLADGSQVFLTAGACIGAAGPVAGLTVDLRQGLERYALSVPPSDDDARLQAAQASLRVLDIAPRSVTVPLIGAAFLAPVANELQVDFGLWLEGTSESGKTSVASAIAAHFGTGVDRHHVLASCRSTYASIEGRVFRAKDVLGIVDDYYPAASPREQQTMEQTVSMLVRGIGNRDGRTRSNVRLEERPVRLPRGLLIFTAEMGLRGHSEQNRLLVVPLSREDVRWDALTATQAHGSQGRLAASMALYIQHLAGLKDLEAYRKRFETYRARAMGCGLTGRAPEQVAYLAVGFAAYASHLRRQGALAEEEARQLAEEGFTVLRDLALAHRRQVQEATPAQRAIDAVREALATGLAHLLDKGSGGRPKGVQAYGWGDNYSQGDTIGWVDAAREVAYLVPGIVYELIVKKTGITLTERALWRQWQAAGWLLEGDAGRNTVRGTFPGTRQLRVLPLKLEALGQGMPRLVSAASVPSGTPTQEEIRQAALGLAVTA